jgi:hypothetical protein
MVKGFSRVPGQAAISPTRLMRRRIAVSTHVCSVGLKGCNEPSALRAVLVSPRLEVSSPSLLSFLMDRKVGSRLPSIPRVGLENRQGEVRHPLQRLLSIEVSLVAIPQRLCVGR